MGEEYGSANGAFRVDTDIRIRMSDKGYSRDVHALREVRARDCRDRPDKVDKTTDDDSLSFDGTVGRVSRRADSIIEAQRGL